MMMMMMKSSIVWAFALLLVRSVSCSVSSPSSSSTTTAISSFARRPGGVSSFAVGGTGGGSLFGIPRGGGLFGGSDGDKAKDAATTTATTAAASAAAGGGGGEKTKYPAMTRKEIEGWLEHIPVFAVTDPNGAGVVLKPENDTSVFYFFLNPLQANATLAQLKQSGASTEEMELKVSAFSLGKIWFGLLNARDENGQAPEVILKNPNGTGETEVVTKGVEYRLVPDTRDLLGARMLLTMSPEDGEKLKESGMTTEMAQAALQKAMTEAPKFNSSFNEIPVFTIAQMRMQRKPPESEGAGGEGELETLLPMYFSLQNMVSTWQQFMSQAPDDVKGVEPAINLLSLHDLIDMMQKESEIDWRSVVLVPFTPVTAGGPTTTTTTTTAATDPMAQMGGATLGDI